MNMCIYIVFKLFKYIFIYVNIVSEHTVYWECLSHTSSVNAVSVNFKEAKKIYRDTAYPF